jgi:hypothetical protein
MISNLDKLRLTVSGPRYHLGKICEIQADRCASIGRAILRSLLIAVATLTLRGVAAVQAPPAPPTSLPKPFSMTPAQLAKLQDDLI